MPERNPSKDEKPKEGQAQPGVSRRGFLLTTGAGVAGLAVGGVAGSQVFPKAPEAEQPIPVQTTWIGRDFNECTGCKLCQIACSKAKEAKIWPTTARVSLYEYEPGVEFPVICYQCGDGAKCVEKCPAQALSIDVKNNNTIAVDLKKCLRTAKNAECTVCRDECPGTVVRFHPVSKAPLICDLCNGDPACVKVCPKGALTKDGFKGAAAKPDVIAQALANKYAVAKQPQGAFPTCGQAG